MVAWSGLLNMNNYFAITGIFISPFLLCGLVSYTSNPYHLKGQDFLLFYFAVIVATIASFAFILLQRKQQISLFVEAVYPAKYNIYQAIYFLYGKHTVLQTAIVDLLKKDILQLNDDRTFTNTLSQYNKPLPLNPLVVGLKKQDASSPLYYETMFGETLDNDSLQHPSFDKLAEQSKQKNLGNLY